MQGVVRPVLEGSIAVRDGRRMSFAEYGDTHGSPVIWLHGTPGGRRQIPFEARKFATENAIRLIALDRPGIGSSTAHQYARVVDWSGDLECVLDTLGISTLSLVGLSGGGPYVLAAAAALPDRVHGAAVLGGVAPTQGPDAIRGPLMELAVAVAPAVSAASAPLGFVLSRTIRVARPVAGAVLDLYASVQPEGDKVLLSRPEFKAMFLDDLLNGSRFQVSAPLRDIVLFARDWGFQLKDVSVPVRWWHGDGDHIVPFSHGQHCVDRLPDATMTPIAGESHLGGLSIASEVLSALMDLGPRRTKTRRPS